MKLRKRWLSSSLAVQVLLASFLFFHFESTLTDSDPDPLVDISVESVNRISIKDKNTELTLVKAENEWRIDSEEGLPADAEKLQQVLEDISAFRPGIPVVTQRNSHERFDVAEDAFYRQIELFNDNQLATSFYVGGTPAMNQSYVRMDEASEVYTLGLNRYQLSTSASSWLDSALLSTGGINRIDHSDWQAIRDGDNWQLTRSDGEQIDQDVANQKIGKLVSSLENLNVLSQTKDLDAELLNVTDSYSIQGDRELMYRFYEHEGNHYVARDDFDGLFRLTSRVYQQLASVDFSDIQVADTSDETDIIDSKDLNES